MRAYLIDPKAETIEQVQFSGAYRDINKLLDIGKRPYTTVTLNERGDAVFVDDEGLLNNPRYFFKIEGYHQPLAGRGLVLGTDAEGESVAPHVTLDDLRAMVSFVQLSVHGFVESESEEDSAFGRMRVFRSMPVFGPPDQDKKKP